MCSAIAIQILDAVLFSSGNQNLPQSDQALKQIHRSFFVMRHAMRQARNRENPKSQPCRGPRNCRNWAIAGHRRSWAWLNFCDAMRCDKRFGVRFWPFLHQSCTKVQELPINLYKLYQTARISWWRSQISKTLSHHWLLLWMVFREFASHASVADRVASLVASQKSFCESRFSVVFDRTQSHTMRPRKTVPVNGPLAICRDPWNPVESRRPGRVLNVCYACAFDQFSCRNSMASNCFSSFFSLVRTND